MFAPASVSVTDDFFEDLGGHSLRAAQMVSRARGAAAKCKRSAIRDLYAAPTIRTLAARLSAQSSPHAKAEPFQPVPPMALPAFAHGAGMASLPVFALSGLQWALPYLIYTVQVTAGPARASPVWWRQLQPLS